MPLLRAQGGEGWGLGAKGVEREWRGEGWGLGAKGVERKLGGEGRGGGGDTFALNHKKAVCFGKTSR